jgi:hypothetical protein
MADDPNEEERFSERDEFTRCIGMALSPYQLIEEYLKFYIEVAHLKIQRLTLGRIPFRFPRNEYENAPMERLITMFARHCDNDDLIERLRVALKNRNFVAHKAIAHYMEHRHDDPGKLFQDIHGIEEQGYDLVEELQKELEKLKATSTASFPLSPLLPPDLRPPDS